MIIAFDLGRSCGWAVCSWVKRLAGTVTSGTISLEALPDEHPGDRWPRTRALLQAHIAPLIRDEPMFVAWEEILSFNRHHGNATESSELVVLQACLVETCRALQVPTRTVNLAALKKHATCTLPRGTCSHASCPKTKKHRATHTCCTGRGNAKKPEMRAAVMPRFPGWVPGTDDETDARAVLAWACENER